MAKKKKRKPAPKKTAGPSPEPAAKYNGKTSLATVALLAALAAAIGLILAALESVKANWAG